MRQNSGAICHYLPVPPGYLPVDRQLPRKRHKPSQQENLCLFCTRADQTQMITIVTPAESLRICLDTLFTADARSEP